MERRPPYTFPAPQRFRVASLETRVHRELALHEENIEKHEERIDTWNDSISRWIEMERELNDDELFAATWMDREQVHQHLAIMQHQVHQMHRARNHYKTKHHDLSVKYADWILQEKTGNKLPKRFFGQVTKYFP